MTVRIIQGDVREQLPKLSADSFDCIVTSPPYFGLRDYGCEGQIGLEPTLDAYLETMVAVCRDLRRVLKQSGVFFINVADSYQKDKSLHLMPQQLGILLKNDGWIVRSDIIWHKLNPMPESVTDRPTSAHETIWMFAKGPRYFWDGEAVKEEAFAFRPEGREFGHNRNMATGANDRTTGNERRIDAPKWTDKSTRNLRNVWSVASYPFPGAHFATMPPDIVERCIKAGSSERGCCPACGAPWVRVVGRDAKLVAYADVKYDSKDPRFATHRCLGARYEKQMAEHPIKTLGWQPSCKCPSVGPIPSRILDPFAGAGTTGLVADRLGRDATLIDLNTSYIDMAVNRIRDDAPLFSEVAAE